MTVENMEEIKDIIIRTLYDVLKNYRDAGMITMSEQEGLVAGLGYIEEEKP